MIRSDIKTLAAYRVQHATGLIKLDAMENPFPLPDTLQHILGEKLAAAPINRYPDADMSTLREKIAAYEGVRPDQVLIGNGSDEIIQMLIMAIEPGSCAAPDPTFVMYEMISRWFKRPFTPVPLNDDFSLDADRFLQIASREKARLAFLACPNNPTGNLWPETTIRRIRDNFSGLLVIDEAYAPFAERKHTHLASSHVVILKTFSKLGWAGLRLGYLIGDTALIEQLNKVRLPYNINRLTQTAADVLFDHFEVFEQQAAVIRAERERMATALADIEGIEVFPSQANFITLRVSDAETVFRHVLTRGILIKKLSGSPLLHNCLRITIGTAEENTQLLQALKESCA